MNTEFARRSADQVDARRSLVQAVDQAARLLGHHGETILYGSQSVGRVRPSSDIDAMVLVDSDRPRPADRVVARVRGRELHLYVVTRQQFMADVRTGANGGYFALKVLNPVLSSADDLGSVTISLPIAFLAAIPDFVGLAEGRCVVSAAYERAIALHPGYDRYVISLLADDQVREDLLRRQHDRLASAMLASTPEARDEPRHMPSAQELRARFYSTGAQLHPGQDFRELYDQGVRVPRTLGRSDAVQSAIKAFEMGCTCEPFAA